MGCCRVVVRCRSGYYVREEYESIFQGKYEDELVEMVGMQASGSASPKRIRVKDGST